MNSHSGKQRCVELITRGTGFSNERRYSNAAICFHNAADSDPDNALPWRLLGDALLQARRFSEAAKAFEESNRRDSKNTDTLAQWALSLIKLRQYRLSLKKSEEALQNDSQSCCGLRAKAAALSYLCRDIEAQNIWHELVAINAFEGYDGWADTLSELGLNSEALEKYKLANEADPNNADMLTRWAKALYSLREYSRTVKLADEAIRLDSNFIEAYRIKARSVYHITGRKSAEAVFEALGDQLVLPLDVFYVNWGNYLSDVGRFQDAIEKYRMATKTNNEDAVAGVKHARALYESGCYQDSIEVCQCVIDKNKDYVEASLLLADTYYRLRENDKAASIYQYLSNENLPLIYSKWGDILSDLRQYKEAHDKYARAIQVNPDDFHAIGASLKALYEQRNYSRLYDEYRHATLPLHWNYLEAHARCANAHFRDKHDNEAIELYKRLVDLRPGYVYRAWGEILATLGSPREAIPLFSASLEHEKGDVRTLNSWGNALNADHRHDEAAETFTEALSINPRYIPALNNLALALNRCGMYDEAIENLKRATEYDLDYTTAYNNRGHILWRQGKYRQARQEYKEGCAVFERTKLRLIHHGESRRLLNYAKILSTIFRRHKEALEVLHSDLSIDPGNVDVKMYLAQVYREIREEASPASDEFLSANWNFLKYAREVEREIEKQKKGNISLNLVLMSGQLYLYKEEYQKAEQDFLLAIERDSNNANARDFLGQVYLSNGNYAKAIECFQAARRLEREDFVFQTHLAEAYLKAEQFDDAEKEYHAILRMNPYCVEAEVGLAEVYKQLGEKDSEYYQEAIAHASKAFQKSESENGSKQLGRKEIAALLYTRGYCKVAVYEHSGLPNALVYVREAYADFQRCVENDLFHMKARRATEKIRKAKGNATTTFLGPFGQITVVLLCLFLFGAAQYGFYFAQKNQQITFDAGSYTT